MNLKYLKIKEMMQEAQNLRATANNIIDLATYLCDHKKPNGEWAVTTGFPIMKEEECCDYCKLETCYIVDYK